jgi:hypothetical protein
MRTQLACLGIDNLKFFFDTERELLNIALQLILLEVFEKE